MNDKIREECDCNEGYGYSVDCGRCNGTGIVKPEMDKIREEFEKIYKGIVWLNDDLRQEAFYTFKKGYKSRDDEVLALTSRVAVAEGSNEELKAENKELKEELHGREQECIDYQQTILEFKDYQAENKKLRDALENIKEELDIEAEMKKGSYSEGHRVIYEALKGGK